MQEENGILLTAVFKLNINIFHNTSVYWQQVKKLLMEMFKINSKEETLACD